jgi:hypothetical protein
MRRPVDLGFSEVTREARERFGARPGHREAIEALLAGRDAERHEFLAIRAARDAHAAGP